MGDFEAYGATNDIDEITYTGTKDRPYAPGDDLPPGTVVINTGEDAGGEPKFAIRTYGVQKTLKATDGKFHPRSAEDVAALEAFGLRVKRESKAETKSGDAGKGD